MSLFSSTIMSDPNEADRLQVSRFNFGSGEMLFMRLCFAVLVFFAIKWEVGSLRDINVTKTTGLANFAFLQPKLEALRDLSDSVGLWQIVTGVGLLFYVANILPVLGLLPALFFSIAIGTLANSGGAMNHSTQLVSMILLGQFLVYAVGVHRLVPTSLLSWLKPSVPLQQRVIYVSLVIFAAGYVVCGLVKLANSDGEWIQRVPWLAVELQKTNWNQYYDTLKPIPDTLQRVVDLMSNHPNLARIFFAGGLFIELFAFLILIGRRTALVYGLLIIVMHLSISSLMQLDFWYHMAAAMIFLVNIPGIPKTFSKWKMGL